MKNGQNRMIIFLTSITLTILCAYGQSHVKQNSKIEESRKKATTQIDMFNRMNNFTSSLFNVDNMLMKVETEEEQGEYNNWLARLKQEDIPEVNQYLDNILPNSKIKYEFSIVNLNQDVPFKEKQPFGRGVIPDYNIEQTLPDFLNNKDTQMEFLLKLIETKNKAN